jgi:2-phosphoglycerate kinase
MTPTVILLGGNSGSGKTRAGEALARALGFQFASADDFRPLLQRVSTADHLSVINRYFAGLDRMDSTAMTSGYQAVAAVVSSAIEIVVANHISSGAPILIEGDTILPSMAAKNDFLGSPGEAVRSAFLIEGDAYQLRHNLHARNDGPRRLEGDRFEIQARFSLAYGAWLEADCNRLGVPIVRPEPFASVVERLRQALTQ